MSSNSESSAAPPGPESAVADRLSALLRELVRAPPSGPGGGPGAESLRPGLVVGRFELVREIGRGGFGVVYEARDRELGRTVAFKAVRAGERLDIREERLLLEAEAAARCSHPNIVTLHDVGRSEHGPYLVLELLRGVTLERRLEAGPLPMREALRIAVEVTRGLAHAHAHGVIHRDLTPGNIFLCHDGQVKVLDLGMAHAFGRPRAAGGTRPFMAPEQLAGAPEDERTDVFALGVVLYRMLTGALPFEGGGRETERGDVPAPRLVSPEAPAIGTLVARMLIQEPAARLRDCGVALSELERIAAELLRDARLAAGPVTVRQTHQPARRSAPGATRLLQRVRRAFTRTAVMAASLRQRPRLRLLATAFVVLAVTLAAWQLERRGGTWENPLADARFTRLTDFGGIEQAAALSRDGRFATFLSDRDGQVDVWVTEIGTGQFLNLTRGSVTELANPSVRTLGFSPDGTLVTFWARGGGGLSQPEIGVWAAPLRGGPARPYLEGVAEYDWSSDGDRLVYHTPGPGDPMYLRGPDRASEARLIFSAPPGLHGHFILWSPDQAFIYFVQGALPDRLDLWRIRPTGGVPERVTHHNALVSHPVFLDARTLLYLASDPDGSGPSIYSLDVEEGVPHRVTSGLDRYTSLAASADGRRVVATMASPKTTLWRVPLAGTQAPISAARRIPLTTGTATSPRLGPGYLLYVSSRGASDSIWKLQGGAATELWSAAEARIIGAPAIGRDGQRVAFPVRQGGRTVLYVVNADGTGARAVTGALELRGDPAWTPDGLAVTVAAVVEGTPRLFTVPLDGGAPRPFLAEQSVDPAWSPDGDLVAFSGADVGTTFPVKAVRTDGTPYQLPALTLTRGARHLSFAPRRRSLLVLRGEIRHKDLWLVELEGGVERQVTDLPPDFDVRDFDVS
ncbi:MAG TPA: protein kinase, partial [Anaeromyxobacter sp.]|nr:protein kinase [Anaeromyxobacter sp.]